MTTLIPKFDLKNGGSTPIGAINRTIFEKLSDVISVKDFGAIGDGIVDDTDAIQAAITAVSDGGGLYFPDGTYAVTEIFFDKTYQKIVFAGNATIKGIADSATDAIVHIVRRQCIFTNMTINGNYNLNYTASLQWHSNVDGSVYPGFVRVHDLTIQNSKIGILYGAATSPIDAPVSENHLTGYLTRGVERCIVLNQPNGVLFMTNCTLDCQQYEWPSDDWSYTVANCIENMQCTLSVSNCEFVKATSNDGWGIINRSTLTLNAVTAEIASQNFFIGDGSETHILGYYNHFWNNSTTGFFGSDLNATAYISATDLLYSKGAGAVGAGKGLFDFNTSTSIVAKFENCKFIGQTNSALLATDTNGYYTQANVYIKNSYIVDTANSYSNTISMSDDNAAWYYQFQDIAKYNVVAGGPNATAAIVASGSINFANALQLTSTDSTSITVATKLDIDGSIRITNRAPILQFSMKVVSATQFYGSVTALYYDDAGVFISSQALGVNGVIGPFTSISGAQEYVTVSRTLSPPLNAAQVSIRFGISSYAQVWRIGNVKVY